MTPTTASTIRAIIKLAMSERRLRNQVPEFTPRHWCHNDAMRAYLLSAKLVAIHAK
jgi:predicted metal-dependent hydrolase